MGFFDNSITSTYDEAGNKLNWSNGQSTNLQYIPRSYTGGAGGASGEDMAFMDALRPSLEALGYRAPQSQMMSGDGGLDAGASQALGQSYLDYLRNTYGDGDFAVGSTRLTGSDSDGGYLRNDLFQRGADGTWSPIDGSGYLAGEAGYKSDGRKIGTILASFLTAGTLNGWGEGAAAAGGAGAGGAEVAGSEGAFLGEGVPSGIEGWDAAYNGAGGAWAPGYSAEGVLSSGAEAGAEAAPANTAAEPSVSEFNPNGLPEGSPYASDFAGAGGGLAAPGATATSAGGTNWTQLGSQGIAALLQAYQSNKAEDALTAAGNQANATQRYIFDTLRADQAPYRQAGYNALGNITKLMNDPSSVTSDPGYQFGLKEGMRAIDNSASARGGIGGAALRQGSRYATDYATTKLNDVFNRNATVAGFGQVANNQGIATGTNYGNNVSQNQLWMGKQQAGAALDQGNIYGNALDWYSANYGRRP